MNSLLGDKCQFAHGRRELRDVVRNTKYKTKTCQKYWKVGYCAYGPRCNFLHDELDEQTLMDWNSLYNVKYLILLTTQQGFIYLLLSPHQGVGIVSDLY